MRNSKTTLTMMFIVFISAMLFSACGEDDNNTPATCSNGVQDGDETGVDCGGSCSPCTTQSCKVTKYIDADSETHIWKYDSQGRVIKDSVVSNPDLSWVINYVGTTVNVTIVNGGITITAELNDDGFPIETEAYFQYTATYESDGRLRSARGVKAVDDIRILDSVMYTNGNIISYRITDSTSSGITSTTYTCTYYTDKNYSTPYNPLAKIYSLFGRYPGYIPSITHPFDYFTPQPFCKNLLKSVSTTSQQENLSYEFDSRGNVSKMITNLFETLYEYDCP